MNCRGCGHPMWKHKTGMNGTTCDAGVNPRGELEPCGCRSWINREESEVTSSDIGMTSSDIPDGVALLDGRTWSVVAAEALPDGDRMARLSPVKNELAEWGIGTVDPDSSRPHDICGSDCWCNPTVETVPASTSGNGEPRALYEINYVNSLMDERNELRDEVDRLRRDASDTTVETIPAKGMGGASRPAQWRHAVDCPKYQAHMSGHWASCDCGLANLRTRMQAGELAAVTPDGEVRSAYEGREEWWLSLIRSAEEAESMYSGDDWGPAVSVARRVADSLEEADGE